YKEYVTSTRTSFPDFEATIDELIIKGNKSIGRWTVTGTNTGPYGELPPTGKKITISGVTMGHVVDGKVSEQWMFYNQALSFTQLGFTITPPEQ
ncbi:MAG: ester cyclase, partial [Cyclobacteriaceae bacterium]|nr:ester cyclase [Cyclobacteriaceae bacterium]